MQQEVLYTIIGGLCSVGLAINAFFIKGLIESINEVKESTSAVDKNLAILITESNHLTARISSAEETIKALLHGEQKIRDGLHEVRTALGNRIQMLEMKDKL